MATKDEKGLIVNGEVKKPKRVTAAGKTEIIIQAPTTSKGEKTRTGYFIFGMLLVSALSLSAIGLGVYNITKPNINNNTDKTGLVTVSEKGEANGVASLTNNGQLPVAQLPTITTDGNGSLMLGGTLAPLALNNKNNVTMYNEETKTLKIYDDANIKAQISSLNETKAEKSELPDITNLATKGELPDITNLALKTEIPDITNLALKAELPNISNLATKDELPDISNLANKNEIITSYNDLTDKPIIPEEADLTNYALKTELPSLTGYATEKYVDTAIESIPETDLTSYALRTELPDISNLALKTELPDITNLALKTELPDITNFITNEDLPDVTNFLTTENDPTVSDWAKETTKPSYDYSEIANTPTLFSGSYTDLADKPALITSYNDLTDKPAIPEATDLTGYATEKYVDTAIENIPAADLTSYALRTELPDISNLAAKSELPDVTNFITTETDPTVSDWAKETTKPSYDYSEITNTPTLFNGSYTDLADKPTLITSYNDLADKPTLVSKAIAISVGSGTNYDIDTAVDGWIDILNTKIAALTNGGDIYFAEGIHTAAKPITIDNYQGEGNLKIYGPGVFVNNTGEYSEDAFGDAIRGVYLNNSKNVEIDLTINNTAPSSGRVFVYGVYINGASANCKITLNGVQSTTRTNAVYGVYFPSNSTSSDCFVINKGKQENTGTAGGAVYGIWVDGTRHTVTNSGVQLSSGTGYVFGIYTRGTRHDVTNKGSQITSNGSPIGIRVDGTNGHTITNNGLQSTSGTETVYGIVLDGGSLNCVVTNTGRQENTGTGMGSICGVSSEGKGHNIINAGTQTTTGTGGITGVYLSSMSTESSYCVITNTGNQVNSGSVGGNVLGVFVYGSLNNITNNGLQSTSGTGIVYGVQVNNGTGNNITNGGLQSTSGTGNNYGVYLSSVLLSSHYVVNTGKQENTGTGAGNVYGVGLTGTGHIVIGGGSQSTTGTGATALVTGTRTGHTILVG